jgi:hypothetical protein
MTRLTPIRSHGVLGSCLIIPPFGGKLRQCQARPGDCGLLVWQAG